jgi:hypothetical protein
MNKRFYGLLIGVAGSAVAFLLAQRYRRSSETVSKAVLARYQPDDDLEYARLAEGIV